jgi:GTP-binding protein EngB required for normal cell division
MSESTGRPLVSELSEDLSWLEAHCRQQDALALQAGQLRLAAALVRNTIGPYIDEQPPTPLHVTVVGGAGAGKSTVVNLLAGTSVAEANPQAGYTRHPVCYTSGNGTLTWPAHLGFLGPLTRLEQPAPSNLDMDVYQIRRITTDEFNASLLKDFVIWDCPDMTTWAAGGYIPRLLEICGLTDVLVYVASDERYNDAVPTQFLQMLLKAGKPVICTLTKMREIDSEAFLEHFKNAVLSTMPGAAINCMAIPYFTPQELAEPAGKASKYRIMLLNQVAVLGEPPRLARARTVRLAMNYLLLHREDLLSVARTDLDALESWRNAVMAGETQFESRYRQEYLNSEKFRRFDEALVRLIELLELPGVGKVLSNAMWVVRAPFRMAKAWLNKNLKRPDASTQPELPVLETALGGWLDFLRKEALQRSDTHPVWAHIEQGFSNGTISSQAKEKFEQGFRAFQLGIADEVERTARSIYEELEKNPVLLNTLRTGKFAMDIGAIVAAVVTAGHALALNVLLVPLAAAVTQQLAEWLGAQYVENQREQTRSRQEALMKEHIAGPLGHWLEEWPSTGGSAYERLHTALKRIPPDLEQLNDLVTPALNKTQN